MKKLLFTLTIFISLTALAQTSYTFAGKPLYQVDTYRGGSFLGTFTLELFPAIAPLHVGCFDSLVTAKFYDSLAFHRVVPGFVIQGGDPNSKYGPMSTWGQGQGWQPTVPAEFSILKFDRGILGGARKANDINSYTSQFFITVANAYNLNNNYTIFGKVKAGMNWVDTIVLTPRYTSPSSYTSIPLQKMEMFISRIAVDTTPPAKPNPITPANYSANCNPSLVQLKWSAVTGNLKYHLEVATDTSFGVNNVYELDHPSTVYNAIGLTANTFYWWRVSSNNGGRISYSDIWAFNTYPDSVFVSAKEFSGDEPVMYPGNEPGHLRIKNVTSTAQMTIYDQRGRLVIEGKIPDNGDLDLSAQPAGIYYYRVANKEKVTGGKVVLMK